MNTKHLTILLAILLIIAGTLLVIRPTLAPQTTDLDPTPQNVTLSGTYECLPHIDKAGPQTEECAFGLRTDDGIHYAVNFGQSQNAAMQFRAGLYIQAEGFTVIKEALSTDQWAKYDMAGIFTITNLLQAMEPTTPSQGKIDITAVCQGALAYMTFPSSAEADTFVQECVDGKHPDVIERFKAQLPMEGAAI